MKKNLFIQINGGLGKNLSFLRIAKHLKNYYQKIYVFSPYWDVFLCSKYIDGVYKQHEIRDFLFDAIYQEDNKLIIDKMYETEEFIRKSINYKDAWCKLCEVPLCDTEYEISLERVLEQFTNLFEPRKQILEKMNAYKDFVIVQFFGGQSPLNCPPNGNWKNVVYDYQNEPLKRHYPIELAQKFIELFKEAHPQTGIIQYTLPNEPQLNGCEHFVTPYLVYYLLAKESKCTGFVSIDSSLQHLITGVTKGVVLWGHSLPETFGYKANNNIIQKCRRNDILYFSALGPSGTRIDYISPEDLLQNVNNTLYKNR